MIPRNHLTNIINSGAVTVFTSITMTILNNTFTADIWLRNWLVSWCIVFLYLTVAARHIARAINGS